MCEISNSLKKKLFLLCGSQTTDGKVIELTQDETNIFWPSSGEFDFMSEEYLITHVVKEKEGSFPVDSDNTGFIGHAGFQDQLDADKLPYKKFHLKNETFCVSIPYEYFGDSIDNIDNSVFDAIINEIQRKIFSYCVYTIFKLAGDPQPFNNKSLLSETLLLTSGAEKKLRNDTQEFNYREGVFIYKGLRAKVLPFSDKIVLILSEDARNAFRIFRFNTSKIKKIIKPKFIELSFEIDMDIQVNDEKSSVLFSVDK